MNGDGLPDIVIANRTGNGPGGNYICVNRGGGRFDGNCSAFSQESATTITPADVNHDGLLDLLVPHRDGGQSHAYVRLKGPALEFRPVPFGPADAAIRASEAADFNADGHVDIVGIDERQGVAVYLGRGDGSFGAGVPVGDRSRRPYALAVSDLNGDGSIDIVVGHIEAPSTVYFNDGPGGGFTPVHFGDSQGTVYGFDIGDVDKDGQQDIAVARSEAPNVLHFGGRSRSASRP